MADSTTAYWGLTKPEVGSSRDSWGAKVNGDLDLIDAVMGTSMPIGGLLDYAGATAPAGWLLCDGSVYTIALYPKLFAVIGNRYGGDGVNNFAVPDLRGRVAAGVGATTDANGVLGNFQLAQAAGFFQWTITVSNLPAAAPITIDAVADHAHTGYTDVQGLHAHNGYADLQGDHNHTYASMYAGGGVSTGSGPFATGGNTTTSTNGAHQHNIQTTTDGGHQHAIQTYGAGGHSHTGRLSGGGQGIPIYSPRLGVTKIIYVGPPGMTLTQQAPPPQMLLRSPMRGMH